jgi:hypothetical protein
MTGRLYAQDVTGTFHEVVESKPTAGVGLSILGRCGHPFLASRTTTEGPSMNKICYGCLGETEKEPRGQKVA